MDYEQRIGPGPNRDEIARIIGKVYSAALDRLNDPRNIEKGDDFGTLPEQRVRRKEEIDEFDMSLTDERVGTLHGDNPEHEAGDIVVYLASMIQRSRAGIIHASADRPRESNAPKSRQYPMVSRGDVAPLDPE